MNWTKIPTNLLISRTPDNELVAIVKYQLLWADLEYQPTDEIALRYMSNKQLASVKQYLNDIEAQVVSDIKSTVNHRGGQKTYYKKKQSLKQNADGQCDNQYDSQCENHTDGADKIRLDKIRKEKEISNDIPKKKSFDENTIFQAGGQGWFFPPEIKKLALGKWKEDEIREIEKQFACQEYTSDVCIADLLVRYPPKPSRAKKASVSLDDITIAPEYEYLRPVLENWLGYKKDIKDEYKSSRGLLACIKQLHDYSGGNLQKANKIVERSMANNWKGIFPLQSEKKEERKNFSNYVGEGSFLNDKNGGFDEL